MLSPSRQNPIRWRSRLSGWKSWLLGMPGDRRWIAALIAINLSGSLYGFNWYREQLRSTPLLYWPVVPDSPLSTLLFSLFLVAVYFGRRYPYLEALSGLAMIKYGLWTPVVIGQHWWVHRMADFEDVHLFLSHLAMAMEAMLFLHFYRPGLCRPGPTRNLKGLVWGLPAVGWLLFNDYMDYFRGFHPALPAPELVETVKVVSMAITGLSASLYVAFLWISREIREIRQR